ncbi:MAG: hypothetical protein RLZZ490_812, partial [Cyanobacteriota bacterium]
FQPDKAQVGFLSGDNGAVEKGLVLFYSQAWT